MAVMSTLRVGHSPKSGPQIEASNWKVQLNFDLNAGQCSHCRGSSLTIVLK